MQRTEYLAYIAGLLDGEGNISINKHRNSSLRGYTFQPCVAISNTCQSLLEVRVGAILRQGTINPKTYRNRNPKHKLPWVWQLFDMAEIIKLLTNLLPYLYLKYEQAKLLIEFCELRLEQLENWTPDRDKRGRFIRSKLPYSDRQFEIYEKLKELNG